MNIFSENKIFAHQTRTAYWIRTKKIVTVGTVQQCFNAGVTVSYLPSDSLSTVSMHWFICANSWFGYVLLHKKCSFYSSTNGLYRFGRSDVNLIAKSYSENSATVSYFQIGKGAYTNRYVCFDVQISRLSTCTQNELRLFIMNYICYCSNAISAQN